MTPAHMHCYFRFQLCMQHVQVRGPHDYALCCAEVLKSELMWCHLVTWSHHSRLRPCDVFALSDYLAGTLCLACHPRRHVRRRNLQLPRVAARDSERQLPPPQHLCCGLRQHATKPRVAAQPLACMGEADFLSKSRPPDDSIRC